ncbi:MAG: FAD:protein FMN transferase [Planctomycetota bacterium]|nr:FAD:protein FMN transferase [Planctomycetota bacterium]
MVARRSSLAAVLALLASCSGEPERVHAFSGPTMGSTYELKVVGTAKKAGAARNVVELELQTLDLAFSNWRDDSEIAKVNAHRSVAPIEVSERFAAVLQTALRVAAATDGAFDPTVKPLSDLYRSAKAAPDEPLAEAALAEAAALVDHRLVTVDGLQLVKARPDVQLDLDGIVAGAAADRIGAHLESLGVTSFYLQITGEVLCRGCKPDGSPWRIGVVDPTSSEGDQAAVVALPLRDAALCSSGDYRNQAVVDGAVMHHVFDPRTGRNPAHRVVSASVLASSCAVADALGTARMVLSPDERDEAWPGMKQLGATGALLLLPGADGGWNKVELEWPSEDS